MQPINFAQVRFDARGLVPCVVRDWRTREVLTLAYRNAEALERTPAAPTLVILLV